MTQSDVSAKETTMKHTVTIEKIRSSLSMVKCPDVPQWFTNQLWLGWATELDNTNVWYVLPIEYGILHKLTACSPQYIEASVGGRVTLWILGSPGNGLTMPAGKVWLEEWQDGLPQQLECKLNEKEKALTNWAQLLFKSLRKSSEIWDKAYAEGLAYFRRHRHLVRRVGIILEESMEDHDLTKTNLVLFALAYMWNWPKGEKEEDEEMKALAWSIIEQRHLAQEDHHPEHEKFEGGTVSSQRLFCDRLSVHIQKDPDEDGKGGWQIIDWIPPHLHEEFKKYHQKYKNVNLYEIRKDRALNSPTFEVEL